jgi:hypothetical protein
MGIFKQLKDMRNVVAAAPDMMAQAQQTSASAQAYAAQAQAAYGVPAGYGYPAPGAPAGGIAPGDPRLTPIAGVDLTTYARISKAASQEGLTADGVSAEAWHEAVTGWPARMRGDMQLAVHYGTLFGQV